MEEEEGDKCSFIKAPKCPMGQKQINQKVMLGRNVSTNEILSNKYILFMFGPKLNQITHHIFFFINHGITKKVPAAKTGFEPTTPWTSQPTHPDK